MATIRHCEDITVEEVSHNNHNDVTSVQKMDSPGDLKLKHHTTSSGGELEPSIPLGFKMALAVFIMAFLSFASGVCILCLGGSISAIFNSQSSRSCPAIWWPGLPSTLSGGIGMFIGVKKLRTYLLSWGIWSFVLAATTLVIMFVAGNFYVALYSVWPPIDEHKGQPLCHHLDGGGCYCQDYFHGLYSDHHQSNVFYPSNPGQDLIWKDSGFTECDTVKMLGRLYYSLMFCVALYVACSLVSLCLAYAGTVCIKTGSSFKKLDEEAEGEEEEDIDQSRDGINYARDTEVSNHKSGHGVLYEDDENFTYVENHMATERIYSLT